MTRTRNDKNCQPESVPAGVEAIDNRTDLPSLLEDLRLI